MTQFIIGPKGTPGRFVKYVHTKGRVNTGNACQNCVAERQRCEYYSCFGGYFAPVVAVKHQEEFALARLKGEV